jgi:hypothetical protein
MNLNKPLRNQLHNELTDTLLANQLFCLLFSQVSHKLYDYLRSQLFNKIQTQSVDRQHIYESI